MIYTIYRLSHIQHFNDLNCETGKIDSCITD